MSRYKRRRRHHPIRNFIITLLLVLIAGGAVLWQLGPLKHKTAELVGTKIIESAADSAASQIASASGGTVTEAEARQQIEQGLNSMESEDREKLTDIIENHMDSTTVADIAGQVMSGDIQGAEEAAAGELSAEEYQQLQELAQKYLGQ